MTTDEARKELESYKKIERIIDQRRAWIRDRKSTVSKLTATLSAEPKGTRKHNDTMAESLTSILDIEAETELQIRELEVKKKVIFNKVMKLDSPYQEVLFNNFIMGDTVESTALAIGYSRMQTFRIKAKALELYANL